MSQVFSTPAGATVTYLSSSWPWSLHASSRNMTFWNDLLSALAQFSLFSSSAIASSTINEHFETNSTFATSIASTTALSLSITPFSASIESHGNARDNLKNSIIRSVQPYNELFSRGLLPRDSEFSGGNASSMTLNDKKTLKMSHVPPASAMNETLLLGVSHFNNITTDGVLNSSVDCNDFTEQKLLNIVICSINDVNNNLVNGSSNLENSTFNETFRNISEELIRLYNFNNSYYYNGTEVTGNDTTGIKATQFESTIYFIQVVTTAVVLGIIILATVIGE